MVGNLLYWAIAFLIVAIFGFGGVAGTAMGGAQILFWIALVLFIISLITSFVGRGPRTL
ncbi:MAG TPA: DUF1328 domain-containing protein [Methylocella sp.]|nr:DUF1328 domain-containing protein [Methylocella sp.]